MLGRYALKVHMHAALHPYRGPLTINFQPLYTILTFNSCC